MNTEEITDSMSNEQDFNHLGEWLSKRIKAKNLGIEEFSQKAKMSRAALYHFMKDTRRPSDLMIARICKALGVPVEEGKAQYTPRKAGRPKGIKANGPGVEQPANVVAEANQ